MVAKTSIKTSSAFWLPDTQMGTGLGMRCLTVVFDQLPWLKGRTSESHRAHEALAHRFGLTMCHPSSPKTILYILKVLMWIQRRCLLGVPKGHPHFLFDAKAHKCFFNCSPSQSRDYRFSIFQLMTAFFGDGLKPTARLQRSWNSHVFGRQLP